MNVDIKRRALHRSRIIEGQLRGLTKAIDAEKYCIDLLTQSLAIQQSLKSLDRLLLENHLRTHVKHQLQDRKKEGKTIAELLRIFTISNKT